MTFITDFATALRDYPDQYVHIDIINFQEPGSVINAGEICTLNVRVRNSGPLDMHKVSLHMLGKSGVTQLSQTDVFGNPINFSNSLTTSKVNVPGGTTWISRTFYMKALKATTRTALLSVHIANWDASLAPLLRWYAGHDYGASAVYERDVLAA